MPKIRLDLEVEVAKNLFDLIHKTISRKSTHPYSKMSLAMLGVELADKIHKNEVVSRHSGKDNPRIPLEDSDSYNR